MCIFLYNIYFEINYHCLFGSNIYIVGNIPEFGSWNIQNSFKLNWNIHDDWKRNLLIKLDNSTTIQYKYVVGYNDGNTIHALRWEEGPSRTLNLRNTTRLLIKIYDIWEYRKFIIRCKQPTDNFNIFYVCGNCEDLGNSKIPQEMEMILKKTFFELYPHNYWEKKFLLPVNRQKNLCYSIYQHDVKGGIFLSGDKKRKVELSYQYIISSKSTNLWEDDSNTNLKASPRKKNSVVFRSPNLFKHTIVDYEKKKIKRLEPKYNSLIIYDNIDDAKPILYKINEKIMLGNNLINESQLRVLKEYNVSNFLLVQKINSITNNDKNYCPDHVGSFAEKEGINVLKINGFDISCKNKQNLKKWAGYLDNIFNKNEKIFVCWSDSLKETFEILLVYLNIHKNFSLNAARKFLHLEKNEYIRFRTHKSL